MSLLSRIIRRLESTGLMLRTKWRLPAQAGEAREEAPISSGQAALNPPFSFFLGNAENGLTALFENPPPGGTWKDVFEQLVRFTPPAEFLALLKDLDSLRGIEPQGKPKAA